MPPFLAALFFSIVFSMSASASSRIPFRLVNDLIVLDVKAGNRTLAFVLDSGAEASLIDLRAAEELGLARGRAETVIGVTTRMQGYWTRGFEATVGGIELPKKVLALDLAQLAGKFDRRIDGLIGADFLRRNCVRIDYARRTVAFLDSRAIRRGKTEIPMAIRGGVFCIRAAVDGGKEGWARVDTGCADALLWSGEAAVRAGRRETSVGVSRRVVRHHPASLRIGSLVLDRVRTTLHPKPIFSGESGLLGNGVFEQFVVTIDAPGRRLILE